MNTRGFTRYGNGSLAWRHVAGHAAGMLMCVAALLVPGRAAQAAIQFEDRTLAAGLTTLIYGGYGSLWTDFDGDGWLDVWIGNHLYPPRLFLNRHDGTFSNIIDEVWHGNPLLDAHGGAWADFDNDGDPDLEELYGVNEGTAAIDKPFYVNQSGTLTNETYARGLNDAYGRGRTPLWLDWNNDGLLDLYVANYPRPGDDLSSNRLMIQQKNGTFVAEPSMTRERQTFFAQLAYFDGAPHLVVQGGPYPLALYRLGNPTPLPVVVQPSGTRLFDVSDVAVADFDGDLADDLFAVRTRSTLSAYRIDPDTRRQVDIGVADSGAAGPVQFHFEGPTHMVFRVYGSEWQREQVRVGASGGRPAKDVREKFDSRGWRFIEASLDAADPAVRGMLGAASQTAPGIYVGRLPAGEWQVNVRGTRGKEFRSRIIADRAFTRFEATGVSANAPLAVKPAMLFRRGASFVDEATARGLGAELPCESIAAGDFDNDGDVDAYLACTDVLANKDNVLLENTPGGFVAVADAGGGRTRNIGTGGRVSVADYDNDGYLDLLVTDGRSNLGYPFHFGRRYLLHNRGGTNHWLRVALVGCRSNRDAIGARVVIRAGGREQARLQGGGIRNGVQDDTRLHFGLGHESTVQSLAVAWPSGRTTTLTGVSADRTLTVREDPDCPRP
jgi:ASPIC and UnbV/FG-GAP-like repeat